MIEWCIMLDASFWFNEFNKASSHLASDVYVHGRKLREKIAENKRNAANTRKSARGPALAERAAQKDIKYNGTPDADHMRTVLARHTHEFVTCPKVRALARHCWLARRKTRRRDDRTTLFAHIGRGDVGASHEPSKHTARQAGPTSATSKANDTTRMLPAHRPCSRMDKTRHTGGTCHGGGRMSRGRAGHRAPSRQIGLLRQPCAP